MIEADRVLSTPPLNSSSIQETNPPPEARAESVDSFSHQPAIRQPESRNLVSESRKPVNGLSRRAALAGVAMLPAGVVGIPTAATAACADAELITLGRQLEPLVDAYYVARRPWACALTQRNSELEKRFGSPADRGYQNPPEYESAAKELDDRLGLDEAGDRLHVAFEKIETIAKAIEGMPCRSIEGLRAKALVAFWEVAPLCADDAEFHFEDAYPFQRLFLAVAELCGLNGKIAATGFEMPNIDCIDEDGEDEGEEA
jgi:hypothetical protein